MRDGPRPLSVHIGLAASSQPFFQSGNTPDDVAASSAFKGDLEKMLLGIQKYQKHAFKPERAKTKEIWRAGEVSLNVIPRKAHKKGQPVLLLVPSLINKAYILDLMKGRSMMRWMAEQGIYPCLLDWGDSCADEGQYSMENLIRQRLLPAIDYLADTYGDDVHALGYCMGGTILAAAEAAQETKLKSLVLLASPWDFHAGSQTLLERVKFWAPSGYAALNEGGDLPVNWIQSVFASLDPFSSVRKFGKFADMPDGPECELFIAVEDWLNDGVSLPRQVALECLEYWFIENRIGRDDWALGGRDVRLENIRKPVLVAISKKDRLVEYEQSLPFAQRIPCARLHTAACGHIGMIAGNQAITEVWDHLAAWVKQPG